MTKSPKSQLNLLDSEGTVMVPGDRVYVEPVKGGSREGILTKVVIEPVYVYNAERNRYTPTDLEVGYFVRVDTVDGKKKKYNVFPVKYTGAYIKKI